MGGKGNCPFLGAPFGTCEMTLEAKSGYGARLGFWTGVWLGRIWEGAIWKVSTSRTQMGELALL